MAGHMAGLVAERIGPVLPTPVELGEIVGEVWSSFIDGAIVATPGVASPGERAGSSDGDRDEGAAGPAMVASVSISGEWAGHLTIVAGQDCARKIAANLFRAADDDVSTAEVADALGEIANMVGGGVKGMVGLPATLSLPQVVLDASALIYPDAREVVTVHALWNGQPVDVSVWERCRGERTADHVKGR
ncbi:MAG: chemotaxis protein CheX [Actinobacteria bacterium]|nr:chemotaxis protein CheX [Actinomycetota bacterium]